MEKYIICSRCERAIKGNTYYTIDIYGHDVNPTDDNRFAFTTATQNLITNSRKLFDQEKCYCKKCRDSIEKFIEQKL